MPGFESPNYTQVPNDLFDRLKEFEKADLKVLMVVIRNTFGYHRDRAKITTREMATLAGLSVASVQPAAEKLEKMGLIEQIKDGTHTTVWRAVVADDSMIGTKKKKRDSTIGTSVIQPLVQTDSTTDTLQSSLKKDKEKETKLEGEVFKLYEQNIGNMTPIIADRLGEMLNEYGSIFVADAITEAAERNARNIKYIEACCRNWKANGRAAKKPAGKKTTSSKPIRRLE